jgi:hypothetical protein
MEALESALVDMVKENPKDKDTHDQLEVVRDEIKHLHAEEKADTDIVTRREYTNAMTAVRKMLDACRKVEADRVLAKKQAATTHHADLDALCERMAAIGIDV